MIFNNYRIIKRCDLKQLLNAIQDLKNDVLNLTNENKELKDIVNKFLENGHENNNNCCCLSGANMPTDPTPETETNNKKNKGIQDTLTHQYNLSLINENRNINKQRYYYKSNYLFYANAKYYKLLNLKFNELMKKYNNDFNEVKQHLKLYLMELKTKEI